MGGTTKCNVDLTLDKYNQAMKIQDESASSSPSSRHYGHYKATLLNDIISMFHTITMDFSFQYRFTPLRWLKATDVVLEKDPGNPILT
eukprot:9576135-Ditylum_brightwellii.AAC.1